MALGLTADERHKLLTTLRHSLLDPNHFQFKKRLRDYLLILLGLEAGLRNSEASHLKISDVWFNGAPKAWIHIPENFSKRCREGMIPVSRNLTDVLKYYVPIRLSMLPEGKTDGWLLYNIHNPDRPERALSLVQVYTICEQWAAIACIPHFRYHDLRHTFASMTLSADGSNLRIVQELLRHRSIASTQIYTHPTFSELANAVQGAFDKPAKEVK